MFLSDNANIEVLPAGYGDCIFMSIHKMNMVFNILVDGGLASTYYNVSMQELIVEQDRLDFPDLDNRIKTLN